MELHAINRRLCDTEYIKSVADEQYHAELCSIIRSFGGEPVPSNFPYSWRRNYEKYENLLREHGNGTLRQTYKPYVDPVAEYIRDWKAYHTERSLLLNMASRQGLSETDVAPFLKLELGDLTTKFVPADLQNDRTLSRDWDKAAGRVSEAYREYRPLTDEQFTIRFLCFTIKQMQTRLTALEVKKGK
jgi:hypothetical protein